MNSGYYAPKAPEGLKDLDVSQFKVSSNRGDLAEEVAYDSSLQEDLMANLENLFDDAYAHGQEDGTLKYKEALLKEYCESIQNVILLAVRNNLP